MVKYKVIIPPSARRDIEDIADFIAENNSPERAAHVYNKISETILGLSGLPERGVIPREVKAAGVSNIREVFFKPYRILYMIQAKHVIVVLISDGRRNMQKLLAQRLLEY